MSPVNPVQRAGLPQDRSAVADALLRKDSLTEDLHANYRRLLELAGGQRCSGCS